MIDDPVLLEKAMGFGGFFSFGAMGIFVDAEYISALEDIMLKGEDAFKPQAFNMELGYSIPNMPIEIAGKFERYQETDEQSTNRFGGVISVGLFDGMSNFALEFLRTDDGELSENSITGQLSIGF